MGQKDEELVKVEKKGSKKKDFGEERGGWRWGIFEECGRNDGRLMKGMRKEEEIW